MGEWIGIIGTVLALIMFLLKYFLSDKAERERLEKEREAEEKKRREDQDGKLTEGQTQAPSLSQGAGNAWDAIDSAVESKIE